MTVWLSRQEAVAHFHAYLDYITKQANTPSQDSQDSDSELDDDLTVPPPPFHLTQFLLSQHILTLLFQQSQQTSKRQASYQH